MACFILALKEVCRFSVNPFILYLIFPPRAVREISAHIARAVIRVAQKEVSSPSPICYV